MNKCVCVGPINRRNTGASIGAAIQGSAFQSYLRGDLTADTHRKRVKTMIRFSKKHFPTHLLMNFVSQEAKNLQLMGSAPGPQRTSPKILTP
jgi:hypothetical protein